MKDWKEQCKKWLLPPLWVTFLLTVFSAVALVTIFVNGWEMTIPAYVSYAVSFYTLVLICMACWKVIPGYGRSVKQKMHANVYMERYLTDAAYKTKVGLYLSLLINLAYVVMNAVSGIMYQTNWFGIFAVYYGIIAIMRFLLVRYVSRNTIGENHLGELRRARLCAGILLTLNLALSGAVLMMIFFDKGFHYQGVLIYVIALYTFYTVTTAIIDMIKYRKYKSPIMSITKVIKMTSALFSMLFLETAMLSQFGAETAPEVKRILIMATGAGISVAVVAMAVCMIVQTTKEISR